jgi:hypothetical protein
MLNLGTVRPGSTIYIPFDSFDGGTGASVTLTGLAVTDVEVYKDGGTTQRASDSGYTLLDTDGIDFDGITGIHGLSISLADNTTAGFWASGSRYFVVISSVTIDAQTVNFVAATFDIGYPDAVLNTTIATLSSQTSFTLTVGPAEDDALNGCVVVIHDVASAVQLGSATVLDYTGSTKTVTLAAGTTFTAAATDNIAVYPPVGVQSAAGVLWGSGAITAGSIATDAIGAAELADGAITAATFAAGAIDATAIATGAIDADSIAADAITAAKIADGAIDANTFAAGAITASAIATDAIGAAEIADGAITAATFAAGAIDAAAIATGAVDADALAADAVAEIADGVWDEAMSGHLTVGTYGQLMRALGLTGEVNDAGATTTTFAVDGFTEATADHFNGSIIVFTSGACAGQARTITDYAATTQTVTLAEALTDAPANNDDIVIIPGPMAGGTLQQVARLFLTLLSASGEIQATTLATDTITAAKIAADAIGASEIADNAIDAGAIATGAITAAKFAAGAIDASAIADNAIDAGAIATGAITAAKFAAGAIDAAAIATGAIDADALASDAVDEIWAKALSDISAVPGITTSALTALNWLFVLSRNKLTQTATTTTVFRDDGSTSLSTSTVSDDATTFTRGEFA